MKIIKPKILNVGSINMDLVINCDRVPNAGETLFGDTYEFIPGGKGANQGVAAARLGADVTFLGCVGDDDNGKTMINCFTAENIDVSFIETDENSPTGLAVICVEKSGQNRITVISGANKIISVSQLEKAFTGTFDAVTIGLEVPVEIVYKTHELAKKSKIPVILDAGPAVPLDVSRLNGIFLISPNETECFAITGIMPIDTESAFAAAKKLYGMCNPTYVVLKMGKKGAYAFDGKNGEISGAYPIEKVVDTTAAGDCFTAALAVQLLRTGDISTSAAFANKAAGHSVTKKGAIPSLPYLEEIL